MTHIAPISQTCPPLYVAGNEYPPALGTGRGHRRRHAMSHAGQGVAMLPMTAQQLPLQVGASLRVSNGLLYPIAGAALGALLLGIPGAILGGVAGWYFARR